MRAARTCLDTLRRPTAFARLRQAHPPTAGTACASLRRSGGYEPQSFTGAVDEILSYRAR